MLHLQEEQYDKEDIEKVVSKITEHLNISIAELERRCNIPEKVLVMSMSGSRSLPMKHQLSLQGFIVSSNIQSLFEEVLLHGILTREEIDDKEFWFKSVTNLVLERIAKEKEDA